MGGFKHLVRLQGCEKTMLCTLLCKMLLFHVKTVMAESGNFQLTRPKKEEEEDNQIMIDCQLPGFGALQCIFEAIVLELMVSSTL